MYIYAVYGQYDISIINSYSAVMVSYRPLHESRHQLISLFVICDV